LDLQHYVTPPSSEENGHRKYEKSRGAANPNEGSNFIIYVTVVRPELVFLFDHTVENTPTVVVSCSCSLKNVLNEEGHLIQLGLEANELTIESSWMGINASRNALLEPTHVSLEYNLTAEKNGAMQRKVYVMSDSIKSSFSLSDVNFLVSMLQAYMAVFQTDDDKLVEALAEEAQLTNKEPQALLKAARHDYAFARERAKEGGFDQLCTKVETSGIVTVSPKKITDFTEDEELSSRKLEAPSVICGESQDPSPYSFRDIYLIEARTLSLLLVDDTRDMIMGLLDFTMRDTQGTLVLTEEKKECNVETLLTCDYCNRSLSTWEPVIEKCQLCFQMEVNAHNGADLFTLNSREKVELNITRTGVSLLYEVLGLYETSRVVS
jgi:hypothetical protein